MIIAELQELLDSTMKAIADNGCYVENNKVLENKQVYVISISGTFYDEYMGDSDWRYRTVGGDRIITDEQAEKLINGIVDSMSANEESYQALGEAAELLNSILEEEDDSFTKIYSTECAEFNNVDKADDYVYFTDESKNNWDLTFNIHKKSLCDVERLDVDERFGCI